MKKKKNSLPAGRQGFTVVELLVYSGILVVFLYVLTNMFTAILDMQLASETASAVVSDGRFILSRLEYDISRASAIVMPASLGAQSSGLTLTIGSTDYTYAVSGGNLQLTASSASASLNSFGTSVSGVSFRRYGNTNGKHSVRIAFTLTSTTQRVSGSETQNFQTTIGLK
jgi:type II secretory pathway component PulJ